MKTIRVATVLLLLLTLVGATLVLTGCEKAAEQVGESLVEGATGVDVEADENKVTIEGENGESVELQGAEGTLPDGFPDDVPVYDGPVDSSSKFSSDGETSFSVVQSTEDSFEDVMAWFDAELADGGWTEAGNTESEVDGDKFAMISATRDGYELVLSVTYEEAPTTQIATTLIVKE